MNPDAIRESVRSFVTSNFYVPDASALGNAESLLEAGIVDSTGVLEVIGFLEAKFGVSVADTEMIPDNLDSIDKIVAFVVRKKGGAGA